MSGIILQLKTEDIREAFFQKVADQSASQWYRIGIFLDVDPAVLDQLRSDFPPGIAQNTSMCAYQMLRRWRSQGGRTLQELHDALTDAELGSMAAFVQENVLKYLKRK